VTHQNRKFYKPLSTTIIARKHKKLARKKTMKQTTQKQRTHPEWMVNLALRGAHQRIKLEHQDAVLHWTKNVSVEYHDN